MDKSGWVIIYRPGGATYQMLDLNPASSGSLRKRVVKGALKTFLTAAQVYWWIKG